MTLTSLNAAQLRFINIQKSKKQKSTREVNLMANSFKNEFYRPAKTLSYITIALLGGLGLCALFFFIFALSMVFFPDTNIDLGDGESVNIGFGLLGLTALLEIPLRICTIVFFLIWVYRAFSNLSPLRAQNLEFSPGWAVGWWFIPFANLVKPFQVMRELYNESDPDFDEETGFLNTQPGTPELIGFWWASFLISNILFRISDAVFKASNETPTSVFLIIFIIASLLQTAAAVLIIFIIWKITKRQELRFNNIVSTQAFAPPPPPNFA